jgi:Na+-driven multidrug efflux pump
MILPAIVTCVGAVLLIPLSPCLIFGWGPFPQLGIAGGAWAVIVYYALGTLAFIAYLRSGRSALHPSLHGAGFRWPLFREILRVGGVAALITVQTNLTIAFSTGFVGSFGAAAVSGYGVGSRLEYLLIPLVFGLGGPLVAMVGTNVGAGQHERALRAAWVGGVLAAAITGSIGIAAALFPRAWLGLFSADSVALEVGTRYLQTVGPAYGLFGLGMALYFSSQGAGRLRWPLIANFVRLLIAAGGGWLVLQSGGSLDGVFLAQAAGLAAFGAIVAGAVALGAWERSSTTRALRVA